MCLFCYRSGLLPFAWQLPASMTYYLRTRGLLGQAVTLLDTAIQTLDHRADPQGEAIVPRRRGQLSDCKATSRSAAIS